MATHDGYGAGSIITPEAVLLDFEVAGVGSRSIAFAIDFIVQFVALMVVSIGVSGVGGVGGELMALIVLLVSLMLIVLGYPVAMETMNSGRSLGRMAVGTRVVTVEGAPVRFRQALIRSLLGIVDLFATVGGLAVASAMVTRRGQRLGDLVAGTMVIRDRATTVHAGAMTFYPPGSLVRWSQSIETGGLGNDGYQLIRDFLSRNDLAEPARSVLANELALFVEQRLPLAPKPASASSRAYLEAVAAAAQAPPGGYARAYANKSGGQMPGPPKPGSRRLGLPPPPPGVGAAQPPPPGVRAAQPPPPGVRAAQPPPPGVGAAQPPPPGGRSPVAVADERPRAPAWAPEPDGFAAPK